MVRPSAFAGVQGDGPRYFVRPYLPVRVALPIALALTMKPASDAVAPFGRSSFSTFSAYSVKW